MTEIFVFLGRPPALLSSADFAVVAEDSGVDHTGAGARLLGRAASRLRSKLPFHSQEEEICIARHCLCRWPPRLPYPERRDGRPRFLLTATWSCGSRLDPQTAHKLRTSATSCTLLPPAQPATGSRMR